MKITTITTSKYTGERMVERQGVGDEAIFPEKSDIEKIKIDSTVRFQSIIGFGGAFTEAGSTTLDRVAKELRDEAIDAYFHPERGINYNFCRTHINSCDFSLENYSYVEEPNDTELKTFSIERDKKSLIPLIKDALKSKGSGLTIFASPWSPPAWMKTNGRMNRGGSLKSEFYSVWANYFARYIKEYKKEGVDIWGISVQNEPQAITPWDNCIYSTEEERDFVKILGHTLKNEGLGDKKIIVWDHNKDIMKERMDVIFSDEMAAKWIWGAGFHWYGEDDKANFTDNSVLDYTHEKYGTNLVFTEGCNPLYGATPFIGEWWTGEKYGVNIINDLNHWTRGWCDWNLYLDERGGPNHAGNYCDAPIIVDTERGILHYNSPYFYIAHFSKFILPGAVRVGIEVENGLLKATAFENSDGTTVVVVMNDSEEDVVFSLKFGEENFTLKCGRRSIMTVLGE